MVAAGRMLSVGSNSCGILLSLLLACASIPVVRCGIGRADRYIRFEPASKFYSGESYTTNFRHTETLTLEVAPHLTLLDPNGLIANQTELTVEGFARIRDQRILTGNGFNQSLACPAYYRQPIMGTLQHRKPTPNPTLSISQAGGFQISCGWGGSAPECCMDVYTAPTDLCPISACVPVPKYTQTSSEWFHLSGSVSARDGLLSVALTDLFGVSRRASASLAGGRPSSTDEFPFRVGAQLPFTREGVLMGSSQTDATGLSYRFFRGDVDEIRLWPTARPPAEDPAYYAFNAIGSADVCSIAVPSSLIISITVKDGSELAIDSSPLYNIQAPTTVLVPCGGVAACPDYLPSAGFRSMYRLGIPYPVAYALEFVDPFPLVCQVEAQDYYRPTCQTYFDRLPLMRTEPEGGDQGRGRLTSDHVTVERRSGLDYWWVPEALAPGTVLHMVVSDLNIQDIVDINGFGTVCAAADVSAGRCSKNEVAELAGGENKESWIRFDYTLYNEPGVINNIPLPMFQHGLLWRPHERYTISGDQNADRLYREQRNPMARKFGIDGYVSKVEDADCPAGAAFCDAIRIDFPDPFQPTTSPARTTEDLYVAYECHPSLRGPFRLLCLEWLVPPNRGWNISMEMLSTTNCPQSAGAINDIYGPITPRIRYTAVIGYEASPEWLSSSEFPKFSAVNYQPVVQTTANCPNCRPSELGIFAQDGVEENDLVQVKVGAVRRMEFLARDRNLDDGVDILPREDPGLPNGAVLQPALPARAEVKHNWECDAAFPCPRPIIYRRQLFFAPAPTQVNKTYSVCFYTRSYARRGAYAYPAGSRESLPKADAPPAWPSVWTDRCIRVKVQAPQSGFVCNGVQCPSEELGERDFTAGSSDCSTELAFTVTDFNVVREGEEKYTIYVSKDPQNPGPESMTLDLVETGPDQQSYKVVWTPKVGVDDKRDGYRTCLLAHDEFFMSVQRLCFTAVVRKCKYCMREGETLEAVGRSFGVDWLQIYLANPHIKDPDNILPQDRLINLGVLYTVRAGDYLDLLSQRFFQSASELQRLNIEVDEDGGIRAGMQMCVMPPVCSVDCLYGTDCYAY